MNNQCLLEFGEVLCAGVEWSDDDGAVFKCMKELESGDVIMDGGGAFDVPDMPDLLLRWSMVAASTKVVVSSGTAGDVIGCVAEVVAMVKGVVVVVWNGDVVILGMCLGLPGVITTAGLEFDDEEFPIFVFYLLKKCKNKIKTFNVIKPFIFYST